MNTRDSVSEGSQDEMVGKNLYCLKKYLYCYSVCKKMDIKGTICEGSETK